MLRQRRYLADQWLLSLHYGNGMLFIPVGSSSAIKRKNIKVCLSRCCLHMDSDDSLGWSHFTLYSSEQSLGLVIVKLFTEPERTYLHYEVLDSESGFWNSVSALWSIIFEVFISQFTSLCLEQMNN